LAAERVLDIGCGVGRFATYFLDRGADVIGVDGDMQSLCRCAWHAAGRPGRLDLYWTSVHTLPEIAPCDLAVACEVLCYVPDVGRALRAIVARLRPGGTLLLSVEARWGWALSVDAPGGGLDVALAEPVGTDTGVLDLTDDRWVRIYQRDQLHAELSAAGLRVEGIWPMLYTLDGPLESLVPSTATTAELLAIEQRCRDHPIWSPLNRVWTAAAVKA
ncbi:MAG: class I SAM-dependent methyltransferase, partial [Myxococcota bacterium]